MSGTAHSFDTTAGASSEVTAVVPCDPREIAAAIEAVRNAARPVVHICLSARDVSEPGVRTRVCKNVRETVSMVRAAGIPVQFSIAHIEEMERPFRRQCIGVAVEAGATRIAVPGSAAEMVCDIAGFVGPRVAVSTFSEAPCECVSATAANPATHDWRCRVEVAAL